MDVKDYLDKLEKKLEKKNLEEFWILVDRDDFKPIKDLSDKELKDKIKKKINYYAGKRIAHVTIFVKNKESSIKANDSLVHLVFGIRKISKTGLLVNVAESLKILYYKDDLENKKITFKDVQRFMKLCADGILNSSVIGGIKYSKLMDKLKEKNIKF